MARKPRVGIIFGGRSDEHEVSLQSAAAIIEGLDRGKYDVFPIGINKSGQWLLPIDSLKMLGEEASVDWSGDRASDIAGKYPLALLRDDVIEPRLDVIIPVVHGPFGEDGALQGLLEMCQIPYVGSGVLASALGMDKAVMKEVLRQRGLPVADNIVVTRKEWRQRSEAIYGTIAEKIGYPCFVKPANLGSSVGISRVARSDELASALDLAARYDRKLVVERAVLNAREVEVSVLGNDEPIASLPGEVITHREFYDYAAKYLEEGTQLVIPALLPPTVVLELQELAIASFLALDCAGMARVDFFICRGDGKLLVNEVNTIPGFTRGSMYPKLWAASGIALGDLLDRLINLAIERFEEKTPSLVAAK